MLAEESHTELSREAGFKQSAEVKAPVTSINPDEDESVNQQMSVKFER